MGIYPSDYRRDSEIDRLLYAYLCSLPGGLDRRNNDPMTHMQQQLLRDVLRRADKAMQDEGVGVAIRDRILHRTVCYESPEDTTERLKHPYDDRRLSVLIPDLDDRMRQELLDDGPRIVDCGQNPKG